MSHARLKRATVTRDSAAGPGDRVASGRDVATFFRADCRDLEDSLQLEMVVAQYLLRMRDVLSTEGVPCGEVVTASVIAHLEREGDALSHAILRGVSHLATGAAADRGADAVARLTEQMAGLPRQFADVGRAAATGAWLTTEGAHDGESVLFAEFEHPRGRRHSLMLFCFESFANTVVKHIGLVGPMSELDFEADAMEELDLGDAGARLIDVLARTYGANGAETDDYRVPIALARARTMLTPAASGDTRPW